MNGIVTALRRPGPDPLLDRCASYAETDIGLSHRFVARCAASVIYVEGRGFFVWDGRRFKHDPEQLLTRALAQKVCELVVDEVPLQQTVEAQQRRARFAGKSATSQRITAMLTEARPHLRVDAEKLDADPWSLNVRNGILSLRTAEITPHDPAKFHTRLVDIDYDPTAECTEFLRFLCRVLPAADVRDFLWRWSGYSLTGSTDEQKLVLLIGSGSNGKTTYMEAQRRALGEYAISLPFASLIHKDRSNGAEATPDLARLPGARIVTASEPDAGSRFSESTIKILTGGDVITARQLHHGFFDFLPTHKLWLLGNHRPQIRGTDHGIWRRILLVPFRETISADERDPDLAEKLAREAAGILAWAVRGCIAWQKDGLKVPGAVSEATDRFRADSDPLGAFLSARCAREPLSRTQSSRLLKAYEDFCKEDGNEVMSSRKFSDALLERGLEKETSGVVFWKGVRLID